MIVPTHSPWGAVQTSRVYAEGIVFVSTASHGGFFLDAERNKAVPAERQAITWNGGQGRAGWYEEDVDWCLVALAYPDHFDAKSVDAARSTFENWLKPKLTQAA